MTDATDRLTQWVIDRITAEFPDDVALLVAVDGVACGGDEHGQPFDYFVPATERGNELAQTFIIGDVGNDLYPRTWERTERTANLDDPATFCLANARILYSRSPGDVARFEALRQKLFDNLADAGFTYRKALENLDAAMDLFKTMLFEDRLYRARGLAGLAYQYLAVSVACLNGTYIDDWDGGIMPVVKNWTALPEQFVEYFGAILDAESVADLRRVVHSLIASTRKFIAVRKPEAAVVAHPEFSELASWYQELKTTWSRISHYCGVGNAGAAFMDACSLQSELDIVGDEFGLGEMDLLGCYDPRDLGALASRAVELEDAIKSVLARNGVVIEQFDNLDAFLDAHPGRNA